MRASDLRDSHSQRVYRQNSKSKYKTEKEVCHTYSLEMASHIHNEVDGGKCWTSKVKRGVNDQQNYRMASKSANQKHSELDQSIIRKSWTQETLTKQEESRAKSQVTVIKESTFT